MAEKEGDGSAVPFMALSEEDKIARVLEFLADPNPKTIDPSLVNWLISERIYWRAKALMR